MFYLGTCPYTSPRPRRKGPNRPQCHQSVRGGIGFRPPQTTTLPSTHQNDTRAPLISQDTDHPAQTALLSVESRRAAARSSSALSPSAGGNHLFIYLFIIYLFIYLFIYLCILSIYVFIYLFI